MLPQEYRVSQLIVVALFNLSYIVLTDIVSFHQVTDPLKQAVDLSDIYVNKINITSAFSLCGLLCDQSAHVKDAGTKLPSH